MGRTDTAAYTAPHRQDKLVLGLDADPVIVEMQLAQNRRVIFGDSQVIVSRGKNCFSADPTQTQSIGQRPLCIR
jgi:hypothetical protein